MPAFHTEDQIPNLQLAGVPDTLDESTVISGLKEALEIGTRNAVDFLSVDDGEYGKGEALDPVNSPGEYLQKEHGGEVIHSYYEDGEPDNYFTVTKILLKIKNTMMVHHEGEIYHPAFTEYIVQKNG